MDFEEPTIEQLEYMVRMLNKCTDSFIFMYDINADTFIISESARKIFDFPFEKFDNALEELTRTTRRRSPTRLS